MIDLNGHKFEFAAASGALGFDGDGWPWEWPLRWAGLLDPSQFTIITKTLTRWPRAGNLKWWCPWRCVRLIPGGAVNAVGLTNPGIDWWMKNVPNHLYQRGYNVIVSIAPETEQEAEYMVSRLRCNAFDNIKGVEINVSCPNVDHEESVHHICKLTRTALNYRNDDLPVLVKLGWQQPYLDICKELDGEAAAFDLINAVPWKELRVSESPLKKYGLECSISGEAISFLAERALTAVKKAGTKTPILSGGGVMDITDVRRRFAFGADAVAFGSIFIKKPWAPNQIVKQWREECTLTCP